MIDASYIKVHPHAAGAVGGDQDMGRTKGGSTQRYIITDGTVADCSKACELIDGFDADYLLADR